MARHLNSGHPIRSYTPSDPYVALAAAFLQRVLFDARGNTSYNGQGQTRSVIQRQALDYLFHEDEMLSWWISATGADPDTVIRALRKDFYERPLSK